MIVHTTADSELRSLRIPRYIVLYRDPYSENYNGDQGFVSSSEELSFISILQSSPSSWSKKKASIRLAYKLIG